MKSKQLIVGTITFPFWGPLVALFLLFGLMDFIFFSLPNYAFTGKWVFGHRQMMEALETWE